MFNVGDKFKVRTIQPVCIYTESYNSQSYCYDLDLNKELSIQNITDDYCLDIVENDDVISVYIPKGMPCNLICQGIRKYSIIFKNIQCELEIDDITFDEIFSLDD